MPSSSLASCQQHPSAQAGWHCLGCSARLCPECVEARRMHTVDLLACRQCGDRAEPLIVHRSERSPLADQLGHAWRYLFNSQGAAMVLGLTTVLTVLGFFASVSHIAGRLLPAALYFGVFWACFFATVRASTRGEKAVPIPDFTEFFGDWLLPALRGLVATSGVWLPLGLYLVYGTSWDARAWWERMLSDPMFYMTGRFHALPWALLARDPTAWVLGLAGLAYFPMALMLAAIGTHPLDMINPLRGVNAIRRLGRDYVLTLGTLFLLGLVLLAARGLASGLRSLEGGFVTHWLAELLEAPVPFVMAHVLGRVLYTRGDAVGHGDTRDYLTPVLPDATPSISLRVEGLGITESAVDTPPSEARARELDEAVRLRDIPAALSLYTELALPRGAISPETHLFVGQAAASYGDLPLAVRALESAADVAPENPLAPRALVLLARVLGERMRDAPRAEEVYRYIVERYPQTDASRFAQARLPPTS